ncbi:MAG: hypothetical protein AAF676_05460 [Pseudomonadota bacterium]
MADKTQRVLWTVCPNGVGEDGRLRLSVVVSPQLTLIPGVTPELSEFPDFLDWPARLAGAEFALELAGERRPLDLVSVPESPVWRAMFAPDTFVRPREFEDLRGATILSYPAGRLHDHLEGVYGEMAVRDPSERPTVTRLQQDLREIVSVDQPPKRLREDQRSGELDELGRTDAGAYALLDLYHRPLELEEERTYTKQNEQDPRENARWRSHRLAALPDPGDFEDEIDFHRIVSSMNQHRGLLRALGLVLDFEMESPGPQPGTPGARLVVDWPASAESDTGVETLADRTPVTRVVLTDEVFDAAPQSGSAPFAGALLPLGGDFFRLMQVELDGSAVKLRNLARNALRMETKALEEDDKGEREIARAGAPALRSGGLALVEVGRGDRLAQAIERSGALHDQDAADQEPELFAEDLARGIHVDVLDERMGAWRSLCRRDAEYEFLETGETRTEEDQEGMVRLGAASSADDENAGVFKLPETTLRWTGWSLTAPPIGRSLDTDDDVPRDMEDVAPPGLPLETEMSVRAGSLPSMRFGRSYRMRARVVDLAHNALPPSTEDLPGQTGTDVTPSETLRRFEPIESPGVALVEGAGGVETPGPGESMTRVAIRTMDPDSVLGGPATAETARRHVFQPKVPARFCETHGVLDGSDGRLDPSTFPLLESRDGDLAKIVLTAPDSGIQVGNPDDDAANRSKPRHSHAPEGFALPWLPDPLARTVLVRIALFPRQGVQDLRFDLPVYRAGERWPDAAPIEFVLREGDFAGTSFDEAARRFTLLLPKAEEARVRLSHGMAEESPDLFGLWHWLTRRVSPDEAEERRPQVVQGRHWMFTPDRELRFYHATQRPLVRPEPLISPNRAMGRTDVRLVGRTPIHAKSTEKVEFAARWVEARDRPDQPAPEAPGAEGFSEDVNLRRGDAPTGTLSFSLRQEFGDTRYRRVVYRMDATSRYREFMPEAVREDAAQLKEEAAEVVQWVPNAASPPAPEVLYVVPTFGWSRTEAANGGRRSFRDGGGLRVYLARPWMVSGSAEMLAVVLPRPGTSQAALDGPLKTKVTQWGSDPVFGPARTQSVAPPRAAFSLREDDGPLAAGTLAPGVLPDEENDLRPGRFLVENLTAPGLAAGQRVDVAAHPVRWDGERRLWYADIVVDPGVVYTPFIRLALARYQPISLNGAYLSPIVQADFAQLSPDRLVTASPRDGREVEVAVFGRAYALSGASPATSSIAPGAATPLFELQVQEPSGDAPDELDWVPARGASVEVDDGEDDEEGGPFFVEGGLIAAGRRPLEGVRPLRRTDVSALLSAARPATERAAEDEAAGSPEARPASAAAVRGGAQLSRGLEAEAVDLVRRRDFRTLLNRDDLISVLTPPELWRARAILPEAAAGSRFRLLLSEYELWRVDAETHRPREGRDPQRRLVFAEGVEISVGAGTLPVSGG